MAGLYISFRLLVHCWFYSNSHQIDRRDVHWLFLRFRRQGRRRQRHNTPKFNNNKRKKKFSFRWAMTTFFLPTFMNDTVHRCGLYLDWRSWHSCRPWWRRKKRKLSSSLIRLRYDTAIWGIKPESLEGTSLSATVLGARSSRSTQCCSDRKLGRWTLFNLYTYRRRRRPSAAMSASWLISLSLFPSASLRANSNRLHWEGERTCSFYNRAGRVGTVIDTWTRYHIWQPRLWKCQTSSESSRISY